jgi:hypothetical protein
MYLAHLESLFPVYDITRSENQSNEKCAAKCSILFDMKILNMTNRGHPWP